MPGALRHAVLLVTVMAAAGLPAAAAYAAPAEGAIEGAGEPGAIRDRYIVTLRLKAPEASAPEVSVAAATLTARFGGEVRQAYSASLRGFAVRMSERAAKRLAADPLVASVQQDMTVTVADTQSNPPWGLDRIDQVSRPLSSSYTYSTVASNVTAYVLDTGIRLSHADFGGRARSGYDFVDNDPDASDCNGHGTHVAGTIGGASYGVAKGVQLVSVRVLDCAGVGSYSGIIAGIEWITAHAVKPAVVNMSLGGPAYGAVDQAIRASIGSGISYAVAAGNSNLDACGVSPARTAEAITVGATDGTDARAWFSNYGPCLDIFAPGVAVTSAANADDHASATMTGTSMATPHVTGAVALLLANHPNDTPAQVRDRLVNGAVQDGVADPHGSANRLLYTGAADAGPPLIIAEPAPAPAPVTVVAPCNVQSNGTDIRIRDLGSATSAVRVSGCAGKASPTTRVEVHIVHQRRGDLVVELVAPNGSAKRLKAANKRDAGHNVDAVWSVNMSTKQKNGVWKLRVRDSYRGNTGFVDSWTLIV
jgi:subtilisin family serine protease